MKKFLALVLSLVLFIALPVSAASSNDVKIWIDGEFVNSDVPAYIDKDRTMVPIRLISEHLGKEVSWDNATRTIEIKENSGDKLKSIVMKVSDEKVTVKENNMDVKVINLDHAPEIKNDRTFVPLRNVAELFDKKVSWDAKNRVAIVGEGYEKKSNGKLSTKEILPYLYNEDMAKKSLDEQLKYEKTMGEELSKEFPGHTNKDVEVAISWLSYHESGYFHEIFNTKPNEDAYKLLLGKKLNYTFTDKGTVLGARTTEEDLTYPRRFTKLYNEDSMASMLHFDYYPNYDGTISTFLFPLHDHFTTRDETVNTYKKIFDNPRNVQLGDFTREEIQLILEQVQPIKYLDDYDSIE